jgi:hypothetical protein
VDPARDGRGICPRLAIPVGSQVSGFTPCPVSAWKRRALSPLVWQPVGLCAHALAAGRDRVQLVTWRQGSRAPLTSHFPAPRVRPPGPPRAPPPPPPPPPPPDGAPDGSLPTAWLLAEWPPEAAEPSDYWGSDRPKRSYCRSWSGCQDPLGVEHDYRELKTAWAWITLRAAPSPAGTGTSP